MILEDILFNINMIYFNLGFVLLEWIEIKMEFIKVFSSNN